MRIVLLLFTLVCGAALLRADDAKPAPAAPTLPRLVDLGAGKCIPCKRMKPILAELTREYADQFTVVFIDVWEDKAAAEPYGIRLIPTQIFYSAEGKELFRHEGFYGKKEILAKWRELGVALKDPAAAKNE